MYKNLMRSVVLVMSSWCAVASAQVDESLLLNGFDLSNMSISPLEIYKGGPLRDEVPAIDEPKYIDAAAVDYLADGDKVLGLTINGVSRAYPIRILNWHEVVNDRIGDQAFSVTYCPLCGSGMVFAAEAAGKSLKFGISGLVLDNNVLLFDRETESLWSQAMGEAISGSMKGARLQLLPVTHTTWGAWRRAHPNTEVLATDTGWPRDYTDNPYELYEKVGMVNFPLRRIAPQTYRAHEVIVAVRVKDQLKAYPLAELEKQGAATFDDLFAGEPLKIHWDASAKSVEVKDAQGNQLPSMSSYWFAWYSFYPDVELFKATD